MHRAALGIALVALFVSLDGPARAQDAKPKADVAPTDSGITFPEPAATDPRKNTYAPGHVTLHKDAKVGDWLEHVKTRQHPKSETKERITIVGRIGKLWVLDETGPRWLGRSLRLVCTEEGKVVSAGAAKSEGEELVAIKIKEDHNTVLETAEVELDTPMGKVKATRQKVQTGPDADDVVTRITGAKGTPFEGVSLGREQEHDGRKMDEHLVGLEETKDGDRPCFKLTLETTVSGGKPNRVDYYVSKTPLFFGERIFKRVDAMLEETVAQGSDGKPVFPLPKH
jgi:hypothetical protein